jgi:hypothetical protein
MASTEPEHVELAGVANEMAERIAEAHEWQAFKRLTTITGNGDDDAWDLPEDYDRLPVAQQIWTSRLTTPLRQVQDQDEWLGLQVRYLSQAPLGSWTLLGGQVVFNPVLASGETAQFYYMTNLICADSDGATKTAFTADDDTFRLDERLLRQGIIWRWKQLKGLPFEVPMFEYQSLLERRITRDGARTVITTPRSRMSGADVALPWTIVP